jgi:hypothetical protein
MPSGKFIEESIKTASWLKFISNLHLFGAILQERQYEVIKSSQTISKYDRIY